MLRGFEDTLESKNIATEDDLVDSIFSRKLSRIDSKQPSESIFRGNDSNSAISMSEDISVLKRNQVYLIKLVEQLRQELSNDRIVLRKLASQSHNSNYNHIVKEDSSNTCFDNNLLKELKKKLLLANLRIMELQGHKT